MKTKTIPRAPLVRSSRPLTSDESAYALKDSGYCPKSQATCIGLDFSALKDAIHLEECEEIKARNRAKLYAPGCGKLFPVLWCGGNMRCGAILNHIGGRQTLEFCPECETESLPSIEAIQLIV